MISHRIANMSALLRMRPDLALQIADRIAEMAEVVARMEDAPVPASMRADVQQPGVISLDARRKAVRL